MLTRISTTATGSTFPNQDVNSQRVGFLTLLPRILRPMGVEKEEVLSEAGLLADALDHPEKFIPYDAAGRLLAISAAKARCPHLGLLLGQFIGTASLGLVGELMRNAPTLRMALSDFAAHQHQNARGGLAYFWARKECGFFGYAVYQPNIEGNSHICDAAAMAAYTIVRELAPHDLLDGMEVMLSRSAPVDVSPYLAMFEAKIHFDATQTAAVLPVACLKAPIAGSNARRRKAIADGFKATAALLSVETRLRRAVRVGLLTGEIHGLKLAEQMQMNRRTLHRRLAEAGISFQQILDETRCEYALQLLTYTRIPIAEIAKVVHYTEPSVFTRAFIRWTGMAPSAWRRTALSKVAD